MARIDWNFMTARRLLGRILSRFRGRGGTRRAAAGGEGLAESVPQTLTSHRCATGPSSPASGRGWILAAALDAGEEDVDDGLLAGPVGGAAADGEADGLAHLVFLGAARFLRRVGRGLAGFLEEGL